MKKRRASMFRTYYLLGLLALQWCHISCTLEEAVVDGFYGGISDTVAILISDAALGAVSAEAP